MDTQAISVSVTDVNEFDTGHQLRRRAHVAENRAAATPITATPTTPAERLSYSIVGGADAALFAIDAASGALSFLSDFQTPGKADGDNVYDVVVEASDGAT